MSNANVEATALAVERQSIDVDIVCVGFGPAAAGFLSTVTPALCNTDGSVALESRVMPNMPLQIMCYERADDIGFGVSGVVTRGKAIKQSLPNLTPEQLPMCMNVKKEKLVYLLDPIGASKRSLLLQIADLGLNFFSSLFGVKHQAFELPYIPPFLAKHDGYVFSIGQFCQWVGSQVMSSGLVQIWPGTPVASPLVEDDKVLGVRLLDQGVDALGKPSDGFMAGMDIHAALTVVADGPVGSVSQQLDEEFGLPQGNRQHEWAVGSKMVVDLPEDCELEAGTVFHTFGYPEPEIFGFMYVYPERKASLGIFVPSWFANPARTSYRYLQHWMMHPYLWRYLKGATMRSWGAKSLQESGKTGEPYLAGHGYARIGEGSGSTNVLTGSGVDEAFATGVQLGEAVIKLAKEGKEFSKENIEAEYVKRRRDSWVEEEAFIAQYARSGFSRGFVAGMLGMGLAGLTKGKLHLPVHMVPMSSHIHSVEKYYQDRLSVQEISEIRKEAKQKNIPLHDLLMDKVGWPEIPIDGKLLVSQQDALLLGGKVQAMGGYADHVRFVYPDICARCQEQVCVEICSGQAITSGEKGVPNFDREKCVYCGACIWNCSKQRPDNPNIGNVCFRTGSGGLHSAEN